LILLSLERDKNSPWLLTPSLNGLEANQRLFFGVPKNIASTMEKTAATVMIIKSITGPLITAEDSSQRRF
jgi:hypothetical protein